MIEKSKYFEYLLPEPNDNVIERVNDFIWVDDNEIICSVPKEKPVKLEMEEVYEQIKIWEEGYGTKKRNMVVVVNPHVKSTKEERDFMAELFPKYVLALAVINHSALGRMAINLFVGLKPTPYPLKVFKNGIEAKTWLNSLKNS